MVFLPSLKIRHLFGIMLSVIASTASWIEPNVLDACPGYSATNVYTNGATLTATLTLEGTPCDVFGADIRTLNLEVTYETLTRIHLKITDASSPRYEIPETVLPRPELDTKVEPSTAAIQFRYVASPFSFSILRTSTSEVLFSTIDHPIIFEDQYLRVKTVLPPDANIYGLGEHTNPFRLPTSNQTITFWSRDAAGIPPGTNLYSSHPIYFEHRTTGTHGVFLRNSNGMDIKINDTEGARTALEYTVIGGVLDFYFLAGSESDPTEVSRQYTALVGTPAEVPYWSFGFHQCRFGYNDFVDVANVIVKYASAGIPLETMWTDIDYMHKHRIFTVDSDHFPLAKMREIVSHLHSKNQKYVLMTDPAVAYLPNDSYEAYDRGTAQDIWLKLSNGSYNLGVVWPGVTVFPDWFHPETQEYWTNEFLDFYNPQSGIDIDGVWIDMNEPASFCIDPCLDPFAQAIEQNMPPARKTKVPDPKTPIFVPSKGRKAKRDSKTSWNSLHNVVGILPNYPIFPAWLQSNNQHNNELTTPRILDIIADVVVNFMDNSDQRSAESFEPSGLNVSQLDSVALSSKIGERDPQLPLDPPYSINNGAGPLSSRTAPTNIRHYNGLLEYDTHNLYGTMMSMATRNAMLARRPGRRPLVITRSTFSGVGSHVGKWLGDNHSSWVHYRFSIAGMLGMASIYQVPMVGSDICGFFTDTTENLCARWAMLGAFYPFMRNHNSDTSISQEFYVWETVTLAAKHVLEIRYRLLDYIYTAFHRAHIDGTPVVNPLWYKYPKDNSTYGIDFQFLFGDSLLVSPVTDDDSTSVTFYLPHDIFYNFTTLEPVRGDAAYMTLHDVSFTDIPLLIRGGAVLPLRTAGAMTTTALRENDFEFIVAPGSDGNAIGTLYIDDGESITPNATTELAMTYSPGNFTAQGHYEYATGVKIQRVRFLGIKRPPISVCVTGETDPRWEGGLAHDSDTSVLDVILDLPLTGDFSIQFS